MARCGFTYIMTNASHRSLYVGVTNNLPRRMHEHLYVPPAWSFVKRYRIRKLVYCEAFELVVEAIAREKQLKSWSRARKERLIARHNPDWIQLIDDYGPNTLPEVNFPAFDYSDDRGLA